jgi:hypothetical protein
MALLWFEDEVLSRPFTVFVFIRSIHDPFSQAWLRSLNGTFVHQVRHHQNDLIVITPSSEVEATKARKDWKLRFEIRSDEEFVNSEDHKIPRNSYAVLVMSIEKVEILKWYSSPDSFEDIRLPSPEALWREISSRLKDPAKRTPNPNFTNWIDERWIHNDFPELSGALPELNLP